VEYNKISDLKVECIAAKDDFEFFGVTLDDVLDRTPAGFGFLRRMKELCAMTQNVTWTNVAYTINIAMLQDGRVSFEFSECLDEQTKGPLESFIKALEQADEETGRQMVAKFEKNIRDERK
jgi:hypothetical protein